MYLNDPYNFKFFNNPTNEINLKSITFTSRKYIFDGEKFVEMPVTEYDFIIEQARSDNSNELNDGIIYVPKDVLLTSTSLEQAVNLVQSKTK